MFALSCPHRQPEPSQQHNASSSSSRPFLLEQCEVAMRKAKASLVVFVDGGISPLTRTWCLFEIHYTIRRTGRGSNQLVFLLPQQAASAHAAAVIDVRASEASDDACRQQLLRQLLDEYGTTGQYSRLLTILLSPPWSVPPSGTTTAAAGAAAAAAETCGVSLRLLRAFNTRFVDGAALPQPDKVTTKQVVEYVIKPMTKAAGCRFLQLGQLLQSMGLDAAQDIGPPRTFISHAWNAPWKHTTGLAMLGSRRPGGGTQQLKDCDCNDRDDSNDRVWLDALAINQHHADEQELAAFRTVIRRVDKTLVCLPPYAKLSDDEANPTMRIWCELVPSDCNRTFACAPCLRLRASTY